MIPENLDALMTVLDTQSQQFSLKPLALTRYKDTVFYIAQLNEEGELSDTNKNTPMRELDLL